jgi:ribosome-binding protein aMBF1 (putative translation factor)
VVGIFKLKRFLTIKKEVKIMQPTSNKEYQWRPGNREELSQKLKDAKKKKGVTYEELAKRLKVTKTWLACAIDGQQWVPDEMAKKIAPSWEFLEKMLLF